MDQTAFGRRRFLRGAVAVAWLGLLSGCGMVPARGPAGSRVPRVGFLSATVASSRGGSEGLWLGLRELGYVDGETLSLEQRYAEGKLEQLPALASELVGIPVDVIVAAGQVEAAAARHVTDTTPIVLARSADPIGQGLIDSLARPGGNVTGLTNISPEMAGKRLELLREVAPGATRVAALLSAAESLGLSIPPSVLQQATEVIR